MKLFLLITLLGICTSGPGKKEKKVARPTVEQASFQMLTPGLMIQF